MPSIRTPHDPEFWRKHVEQFLGSGLTQREYCRRNGIKHHQLIYWKRKVRERATSDALQPTAFVRAEVNEIARFQSVTPSSVTTRIHLGAGVLVEIEGQGDPLWIARLIKHAKE